MTDTIGPFAPDPGEGRLVVGRAYPASGCVPLIPVPVGAEASEMQRLREELARLQLVWEDTRKQRDELLEHLTSGTPLPKWAEEWIKVYKG